MCVPCGWGAEPTAAQCQRCLAPSIQLWPMLGLFLEPGGFGERFVLCSVFGRDYSLEVRGLYVRRERFMPEKGED